ncbi:MAG: hypothetical protein JO272_17060 [Pseudonocardiales bacterium]|nr:hypothetical protein [Pseudonocardiales bacterium]
MGWRGKNYSRSPPHGGPLLAVCELTHRGTPRCRAVLGEYCTFFVPVSTATTGRCRVWAPEIVGSRGEVNSSL